jgi:U4/U6.U5 tri-snRNP-associated protein 2
MSKRPAEETLEILEAQSMGPLKRVRANEVIDEECVEGARNGTILEASRPRAPVAERARDEGSDEDEGEDAMVAAVGMRKAQDGPSEGFSDLYLDTINR